MKGWGHSQLEVQFFSKNYIFEWFLAAWHICARASHGDQQHLVVGISVVVLGQR